MEQILTKTEIQTDQVQGCPLISVIIPVYNVEKYLRECVESVLAQSIRLGVSHRTERESLRMGWYAPRDSVAVPDTLDTLGFDDELGGFEEEEVRILARDTMKVPDSLRTVDPWLFKYYITITIYRFLFYIFI